MTGFILNFKFYFIVIYVLVKFADYGNDITRLANTPTQTKSLLYSLEQAAGGIGLYVNVGKTEYMCFNQTGDISILNGGSLKLGHKFTYLESSILSTENGISM